MLQKTKKLWENLLLLIFILIFVYSFDFFFSKNTSFISAFGITALLMFAKINLGMKRKTAAWVLAILFPLAVLIPAVINSINIIWIKVLLVFLSAMLFMIPLAPSLKYQSYLPFMLLFASNLNTPLKHFSKLLIASVIAGIIIGVVYYFNHPDREENFKQAIDENRIFIFKMILGLTIGYAISLLINSPKSCWILLTIISLTEVSYEYTKQKLSKRLIATIIGSLIYLFFITKIAKPYHQLIPFLMILISYIYTFIENYFIKMIFVTFNAINASVMNMGLASAMMIPSRIIYSFIGAFIAIVIGMLYRYEHQKASNK